MNEHIVAIVIGLVIITFIICFTIYCIKELANECKHKWNTVYEYDIKRNGVVIGTRYIQQCVHCGTIQNVDCMFKL